MESLQRMILRNPWVTGAILAGLMFLVAELGLGYLSYSPADWPFVLWALGFALPLLVVASRPEWSLLLQLIPLLVQVIVADSPVSGDVAALIAIAFLTALRPWRKVRWWLVGSLVAAFVLVVDWTFEPEFFGVNELAAVVTSYALVVGIILVAVLVGAFVRGQQEQVRSWQRTAAALEQEQQLAVQLATEEERSRIATDMHDIIAHSLAVIALQTDAAGLLLRQDPRTEAGLRDATAAIDAAHEVSVQALRDTRQLVGALSEDEESRAPQPSLADVPDLVARLDPTSERFSFVSEVDAAPMSVPAQVACYRIIQEALTNVIRHAGPKAQATVRLSTVGELLQVEISDNGAGSKAESRTGHGLVNMEQRAKSVGGAVTAGPNPAGGFTVRATLPLLVQETAQ